ncbi:hypothetical protein AB1Y20_019852 [Prymnesium parvum]|uniref:RING-type domain-containing protein n=1 Tax=Prymnesium parvum TaxID=97485 RepID=A0AB34JS61_PRYPA
MVLLAFGSTLLVIVVCVVLPAKFRVYARRRYEAGRTSMCCGCIRLRGMEQQESAPRCWSCEAGAMSVTCSRTSGIRLYWSIALPPRSAEDIWVAAQIEALPAHSWSKQGDAECSLCMEPFSIGELVRTLPCEHGFHDKCIKPWLLEGQKGRRERNCPLCRTAVAFRERDVEPVAQIIEMTTESVV